MDMRNISAWAIRNPVIPIVLFIGMALAGLVSFSRMDVQDMPDIEMPMVMVQIAQPGASPSEITTQITQRVEAAVRSIEGVNSIGASAREGSTTVTVEFNMGEDVNAAVNEVKNAVDQIRGELPDGIMEPQVSKMNMTGDALAFYAVQASDMTIEQSSWFVDDIIARRLLSVPGMASVQRAGGVNREIRVILDPAKMQSLGVTASQVSSVLRQQNTNAAGGQTEIAGSRQAVRVLGNAKNAFELGESKISLSGGRAIKLSDIAAVSDGYSEQKSISLVRGKQVVNFAFYRARGESDVTVFDGAMREMKKIEKEYPNVKFIELFNGVSYTKGQYRSSMESMIEGALLAVVVVFLFLRDWRATIISALAIPLSAIPTFWFLDLMGFTLNTMSLLALGLVAGVLVDDAIVEIENIVRHMRMGKSAYQAAIDAADEIGLAVVATTFAIVAVFLPVGLMSGVPGQFFKNFGLTVVASVLMSLAVARMITPMIAAYFMKAQGTAEHGEGRLMDQFMAILRFSLDASKAEVRRAKLRRVPTRTAFLTPAIFLAIAAAVATIMKLLSVAAKAENPQAVGIMSYLFATLVALLFGFVAGLVLTSIFAALVRLIVGRGRMPFADWGVYMVRRAYVRVFDHRLWVMGLGLLALLMSGLVASRLETQFFPEGNYGISMLQMEMVPGTTLERTREVTQQVAAIIDRQPDVKSAVYNIAEGSVRMFVSKEPERTRTDAEFKKELGPVLQRTPDARVTFNAMGPGGGGGSGSGRDVSIMLSGSNPELLRSTAATLVEQMKGLKEVRSPRIAADMQRPELIIKPRREIAAQLGITTAGLSQAIRIATLGDIDQNAAKFSLSDRQISIKVLLGKESRKNIDNIRNLPVPTTAGGSVPLSRVADISFGAGPTAIQRQNQNFRVFVGADFAPGVVTSISDAAINNLPIMKKLPSGVSRKAFGSQEWQEDMVNQFSIALVSGMLLVFSVLVLLYKRFMSPLINMGSLILAPFGGFLALFIAGQPLSLPVFIGLLMLFGIVAKNSILLIDFAIEEMARGVPKYQAIMEAGHKRAQPIVMTTVAMVAGMVPTALSLSGDGAFRAPMGTVVIGGLIVSTLLTLLIVPAGFSLADGLEKRIGPFLRRKLLTFEPGDDQPGGDGLRPVAASGGLQPAE